MLTDLSDMILSYELVPRHGPGATAERISGNRKFNLNAWHTRLQPYFPFDMYGHTSPDVYLDRIVEDRIEFIEPDAEMPVRVITVPKTLKGPRIIAIEPVCMQYVQQSLLEPIVRMIETGRRTSGHVNFSNQHINGKLALDSSLDRTHATIDLSDASDRVHKDVVAAMLESVPLVQEAIFACRSQRATLPSGKVISLEKFASMGSALCFPIESMVFFTLCILARLKARNLPITSKEATEAAKEVYVYGDDIIVPTDEVSVVSFYLELFGLKVNENKTFGDGYFRESCGVDAYKGVDVTPVYIRHMSPANKQSTSELVSFVSLANQLYKRGWWATAKRVRAVVERILGQLPHVQETTPCLGWESFIYKYSFSGWDRHLHKPKTKGYVVKAQERSDPLNGWGALMKFFLKRGSHPIFGRHLERSVRPGSVNIKFRWVPV